MTSTPSNAIDISDLPTDTPSGIKSFISNVRMGYSTKKGTFEGWKRAMRPIIKHAPVMHLVSAIGIGALMRPLLRDMPGGILFLQGASTTGKSIALQTALSIRANPADMTWGFDSMATLKWYTLAAEHNFLCLDDINMAILPDDDSSRPVSSTYLLGFDDPANAPHTTIIATGNPNLRALAGKEIHNALEIDAQTFSFWPTPAGMNPWWMDESIGALKMHYGRAHDRIADSLSKESPHWRMRYEQISCALETKIPEVGRRALFVQAALGQEWLTRHAGIRSSFEAYRHLLNAYAVE